MTQRFPFFVVAEGKILKCVFDNTIDTSVAAGVA